MLRFLRSIRLNLVNEGKTSKYFRYAIGEFVLIVAGILVAMEIQNWNEGRKLERQRQVLIENLRADFEANRQRLEEELLETEEDLAELEELIRHSGGEASELTVSEFKDLAFSTVRTSGFEPVLGAYRAALSTGSITLLGSRELNTLIIEFESRVKRLDDLDELFLQADFSGIVLDVRRQVGSFSVLRGRSDRIPENYKLSDEEFRKLVAQKEVYAFFEIKRELKGRQRRNYNRLKSKTEEILAALDALK